MKTGAAVTESQRSPKYLQVVDSVIKEIEGGTLRVGDRLPSINEACVEWYLSKDSVKRAYDTLYRLGLITSVYRKGYFIVDRAKRRTVRMLIITGQLTESVKQLHDAIARQLGRGVVIDICTFNFRQELLCQMIDKQLGNYHYFLVMPHLLENDPSAVECLHKIPKNQLILLGDQWSGLMQHGYQISYGGEQALYDALTSKLTTLRRYTQLNLVLPNHDFFDADYIRAFRRFCDDHDLDYQILDELDDADIEQQQAYFVADSVDLSTLVQHAQRHQLRLGQQLGIISFIDNDYTRLLAGGVSVIGHPSSEVGCLVAQIVQGTLQPSQPYSLPLQLAFRSSC